VRVKNVEFVVVPLVLTLLFSVGAVRPTMFIDIIKSPLSKKRRGRVDKVNGPLSRSCAVRLRNWSYIFWNDVD